MLKNPACEFLPSIRINQDVYDTLVLNAAKRLVAYELANDASLSMLCNQPNTVAELVFPGEGNNLDKTTE